MSCWKLKADSVSWVGLCSEQHLCCFGHYLADLVQVMFKTKQKNKKNHKKLMEKKPYFWIMK